MVTHRELNLTRQQLLDLVWSKPMVHLARELGLSDSGLAKICRRHRIPRPPTGYFLMREDRRPMKPDLPDVSDPQLEAIRIYPRAKAPSEMVPPDIQAMLEAEMRHERPFKVSARLTQPHPLVRMTRKYLETEKPYPGSPLIRSGQRHLSVRVAPASVARAMRILDALIKAAEARGFQVKIDERGRSYLDVAGERIPFRLVEKVARHERSLTADEEEQLAAGRLSYLYDRYTYTATGRLSLLIDKYSRETIRKRWKDGPRRCIEDGLSGFFVSVLRFVAEAKAEEARKARAAEAYRQWAEEREERRRLIEEEQERVDELLADVEAWHLAGRIREYVWAVQVRSGEINLWSRWALAQADRIDPRVPSPPSILDEKED